MNLIESFNTFIQYGFWTAVLFACTYIGVQVWKDTFDPPGWFTPVVLVGVLALWLLIPQGWHLMTHAFGASWDYGDDVRVSVLTPDGAWFVVKTEFWAAIVGTFLGYLGLGKLRHEW